MGERYNRKAYSCKIENCFIKHYAKGYCKKHYEAIIIRNGYKTHKCKVINCNFKTQFEYCNKHKSFWIRNNLNGRMLAKIGNKNPRWNGGTSEYPNHSFMKKQRNKLIKKGTLCKCGKLATHIHHKDSTKFNHSLSNLEPVCGGCHYWKHH